MSRAINIDATQDHVVQTCAKHGMVISSIEALHPRGTRVVMKNQAAASTIADAYGKKVIVGTVTRTPARATSMATVPRRLRTSQPASASHCASRAPPTRTRRASTSP